MSALLNLDQKVAEKILETVIKFFIGADCPKIGCIGITSLDKRYTKTIAIGNTSNESILETNSYLETFEIKRGENKPFLIEGSPHFIAGVEFEDFIIAGSFPISRNNNRLIIALYGIYHEFQIKHEIIDDSAVDRMLFVVEDWDKKFFHNQKLLYLAQQVFKPEMFSERNSLNNKVGNVAEEDLPGVHRY